MQDIPHTRRLRVGEEGKAQVGGGLVVMQLVLPGSVADEGVVLAAELARHVAQGEDGSEDEFGVVGAGDVGAGRGWASRGEPGLGVDAFGWWGGMMQWLVWMFEKGSFFFCYFFLRSF